MTAAGSSESTRGGGAIYLVLVICYLAAVFAVSHIPGRHLRLPFDLWDKAIHFAEYVPVGFLLLGWLSRRRWVPGSRLAVVGLATAVVAAFGALDELHQYFVPERSATLGDALADLLGGLAGAALGALIFRPGNRRRDSIPSGSRTT
jgi:VanZ family protein